MTHICNIEASVHSRHTHQTHIHTNTERIYLPQVKSNGVCLYCLPGIRGTSPFLETPYTIQYSSFPHREYTQMHANTHTDKGKHTNGQNQNEFPKNMRFRFTSNG
jgi:hypothetical protein